MLGALMIGLSLSAQARIRSFEDAARRSATFRRLLAETHAVARRAGRLEGGSVVLYEPPPGDRLVFDERALEAAAAREFDLAEARQLARASMGLPVMVREAELAAIQAQLRTLLELAAGDPVFSRRMAALAAQPPPSPRDELGRAALAAGLLAAGPRRLEAFAGRVVPGLDAAVPLSSLTDRALAARAREAIGPREDDARGLSKKLKAWMKAP